MPILSRRNLLRSGLMVSASSALTSDSSLVTSLDLLAKYSEGTFSDANVAPCPRERLLFDHGWKFFFGNTADPECDLGFGSNQEDFDKSGRFKFAKGDFDDSKWRSLNLPHDWAVELPFVHDDALNRHGYKPLGRRYPETTVGWYRREFEIPKEDFGRRVIIEFDGVFHSSLVFLNGFFLGRNDSGYTPFQFDLTNLLNYGEKNYLVVRVDASFGEGWFYEGAGIYRHVWLTKTNPLHLEPWESYVRSEVRGDATTLSLGTMVQNDGGHVDNARVRWRILDATGKTISEVVTTPQSISAGGSISLTATTTLTNPILWSPETPNLYSMIIAVESNGSSYDAERLTFGVRTIEFDVDAGFFLNGASIKIKGTCNHQDHAGVGAAVPDRLQWYRLAILKKMGSNAVRTSHNMPTPEWVEACDRMGMMMMCETRSMSSTPEALAQLEIMVKRYRNSPAIILWSMGNEEWELQKDEQGKRVMTTMIQHVHKIDPTRLCTAAVNGSFGIGISEALEVEGINYNLTKVDDYHKSHPRQPLIGTETASTVSTRGIYETNKLRNWVSAYDVNRPPWAETSEGWWKFYAVREWLSGGFAWTGFDYRGEPTPYSWPSVNSQFGIVDMCGFPKDNYYYYKAWWGREKMLHLFPHWNWEQREGELISVWVHSNVDEVELFLNGVSQGSKKVLPLTHLEWKVRYVPGTIEAQGRSNGKLVITKRRETTGAPSSISLTADRIQIDADGRDIAILRVEALDKEGRFVPTADNRIVFRIHGEGILIGVGNGDPNCQESDKNPERSLFSGLAQVIVQASNTAGRIIIEADTQESDNPKLKPAKLIIATK